MSIHSTIIRKWTQYCTLRHVENYRNALAKKNERGKRRWKRGVEKTREESRQGEMGERRERGGVRGREGGSERVGRGVKG